MANLRCPLSYDSPAPDEVRYSATGLKRLHPRLRRLEPLPHTGEELLHEAATRMEKMSIGGVQPKGSAALNAGGGRFQLTELGGTYILKPNNPPFPEVPQNEDLTTRMAAAAGVLKDIKEAHETWGTLLDRSFLSEDRRTACARPLVERRAVLAM